jgi:hypothetical protein
MNIQGRTQALIVRQNNTETEAITKLFVNEWISRELPEEAGKPVS